MSVTLLGNYVSAIEEGDRHWGLPPLCSASLDFSSTAKITESDPTQPRGCGLFICDEIPEGWDGEVLASEDIRDARSDGRLLNAWESLAGYRPKGDNLVDLVFDHLTNGADPDNLDNCGMLIPTADLRLEIWLGGVLFKTSKFHWSGDYASKIKSFLTKQFQKDKQESLAGKSICPITKQVDCENYLKNVDATLDKYSRQTSKSRLWEFLKPSDWSTKENPKRHNTIVTDDFNRANQTGLGANWTAVSGTIFDISTNQARGSSTNGAVRARYESDLSSVDSYAQVQQVANGTSANSVWIAARYASAVDTCYLWGLRTSPNNTRRILKLIASTATELAGDTTVPTFSCTTKITVNGSSLKVYINGSEITGLAITDTAIDGVIVGGKRSGMQGAGNSTVGSRTIHDNFEAGDLTTSKFWIYGPKP